MKMKLEIRDNVEEEKNLLKQRYLTYSLAPSRVVIQINKQKNIG